MPLDYESFIIFIDVLFSIFIYLPVAFITIILFFVWLYKLHSDLSRIYINYPVSPLGSIARFLIPFYNLWGIWNVLATMRDHFKKETNARVVDAGRRIGYLIPIYYIVLFVSTFFLRAILKFPDESTILLASNIFDFFYNIILLLMYRTIYSGMNDLFQSRQK